MAQYLGRGAAFDRAFELALRGCKHAPLTKLRPDAMPCHASPSSVRPRLHDRNDDGPAIAQ